MKQYGIIGDCNASPKLVKAALTDQLETHDLKGEEIALVIGVRHPQLPIYDTIIDWAHTQDVPYTIYSSKDSSRFMRDVVEELGPDDTLYALLGDEEPSTDVSRALYEAIDQGMEVRDLAEAGLTYVVGLADEEQTKENNGMAEEEVMTLEQAGEAADAEDEEAIEALTELAKEADLDPDDYETWVDLAVALEALEEEEPGDEPEPEADEPADEPEEEPEVTQSDVLTAEELEALGVRKLRHLAQQLGVEGHDTLRTPGLIKGILAAQGGEEPEADEPEVQSHVQAREEAVSYNTVVGDGPSKADWARAFRAFADALEA